MRRHLDRHITGDGGAAGEPALRRHARRHVQHVLFAVVGGRKLFCEAAQLNLGELCEETADRLGPTITPQIDVAVEGDVGVEADREKVRQIVTNLLMNASHAGAKRVGVTVDGSAKDSVRVSVTDDGSGVSAEVMPRLFAPFATGRADGTGLGLAVSRSIAAAHGGDLQHVQTSTGARFDLTLPRAPKANNDARRA